ncbi:uncharacterized protein LOC134575809 isoform X2 [Pelobates fuscus]|uniref:uncharacterized protein LOC134575809 isoform X2 n=1 Tax=Pelobates fuscus TaxID=191477 RepID=UPI002FE43761
MVKKNSIPERWRTLSSVGQRIPGSRFIAFKVPLKGITNQRVTKNQKFTPKDLLNEVRVQNQELGLIIDLTNTERYYTIKDLPKSVQYVKMHTAGLKIPDDSTIHQFKRIVRRFIWNNTENDKLIGVHCTTGINRTGYLICRYLIDVDGWDPETAISTFSQCRGHPIEGNVYLDDLVKGATRSNLGIDQPPTDDIIGPLRKEREEQAIEEEERNHPYSEERRKAVEAFLEARRRTERQKVAWKMAAEKQLKEDFGDFDARNEMQDFDARNEMKELRQVPITMRARSPDYRDIDFLNAMSGPRERPFPPHEEIDDHEFPVPFEHRERFFHGSMLDEEMMHPEEYRRMQFEKRREMRGPHPMEFEGEMFMEDHDCYDIGPREMPRPAHGRQPDMSRENMGYDDIRQRGRFGKHPGLHMYPEEEDFENGPGGPMPRPYPGQFRHGGPNLDNDDIDEMDARHRFERNQALKSQAIMEMEERHPFDDHGFHPREAAHMPGPMRGRPMDGPINERMRPMGEGMRPMGEGMRPMGEGMRPMGEGMRPMGEGMRPMGEGMHPMDERMPPMSDGMRPIGERMHPMAKRMHHMDEQMLPMEERMHPMAKRMHPMDEQMHPMGKRIRPMEERMHPMDERMRHMDERMHPMDERMRPMEERMHPMDEQMHPMGKHIRPMDERIGSISEVMHPKDARLSMNKPNVIPGPMRNDPMNERIPRLAEGRKTMPPEELMQGVKRFAPYPSQMKAMQPNKERPGPLPTPSINYNYGMPSSNQNQQSYPSQAYPPAKLYN